MKIVVINGTEQKGCTFEMKEMFLSSMGSGHNITEFYLPRDCPVFCTGCKRCFFADISVCPHSEYTVPIWDSILEADLLVLTSPTYVFHVTAQMKALLDHFATKWMAHSPEKPMFYKQAVIITNAIGKGMEKTAKDIRDSLDFWGIARTYVIKQALFKVEWDLIADKEKAKIKAKCENVSAKIKAVKNVKPHIRIKFWFYIMRFAQKLINKKEPKPTKDYLYWKENGWLDGKKPWKD